MLSYRTEASNIYQVAYREWSEVPSADALVLAVAPEAYPALTRVNLFASVKLGVVIDVNSVLDRDVVLAMDSD